MHVFFMDISTSFLNLDVVLYIFKQIVTEYVKIVV